MAENLPAKIEQLNKETLEAARELDRVIAHRQSIVNAIPGVINGIKHDELIRKLVDVSVDELADFKEGIRIATLKNAGINNIAQIYNTPPGKLEEINGIGEESEAKIRKCVYKIASAFSKKIRIKLDPYSRTRNTDALVYYMYVTFRSNEMYDFAVAQKKVYKEQIQLDITQYRQSTASFAWFFTPGATKDQIRNSINIFEGNIRNYFLPQTYHMRNDYDNLCRSDLNVCWEDFKRASEYYYAYLDRNYPALMGNGTGDEDAGSQLGFGSESRMKSELQQVYDSIEAFPIDSSLMKSVLRRYQEFGTKYFLHQKRVLLGDEMGLGKTIQAIAALAHVKAKGAKRMLVICPLSVMINWTREIEKHSHMKAIAIHGADREEEFDQWLNSSDIGVTTYETLSKLDFSIVEKLDMVVVDEAHNVKNPNANRTNNVRAVAMKAEHLMYMTGTPLENKLDEMKFLIWSVNKSVGNILDGLSREDFKNAIIPVYLRRIRDDVLTELPELIEVEDWLSINKLEREQYYADLTGESFMAVRRISWNVPLEKSTKASKLLEICEEAKLDERKVLVFSYFRTTIESVAQFLGDRCIGIINGDMSAEKRQEMVDEFTNAAPGTVLVSQIEAGGVGLNIQTASIVVLCEPQYKPSIENQAISRVYRMGQIRSVIVHRLLIEKSVDERLMEILKQKKELFDMYAEESAVGEKDAELEKDAFKKIVADEIARLNLEKGDKYDDVPEVVESDATDGNTSSGATDSSTSGGAINGNTSGGATNAINNNLADVPEITEKQVQHLPAGTYIIGEDIPTGRIRMVASPGVVGSVTLYGSRDAYQSGMSYGTFEIREEYYMSLRAEGCVIVVENAEIIL